MTNFYVVNRKLAGLLKRIINMLYPQKVLMNISLPDAETKDILFVDTKITMTFFGRLLFLFTNKAMSKTAIACENKPGKTKASTVFYLLPPGS